MPDVLKNYYELSPLTRKAATEAILRPATAGGNQFISPVFAYRTESLDMILDYLTAKGEKPIETFQLQTICQYAENLAIENRLGYHVQDQKQEVQPENLGNLKNVFRSHYDNLISKISPAQKQLAARLLIENKLIIDGNRVSLPDVVVLKEQGVDKTLIAYLHDTHHIIRSEPNTTGGISYELSHDTLVAPILEAKKVREEAEEEARAEAERQEELRLAHEKAEKERVEKDKQRKIMLIMSSIAFLALIALIVSVVFYFDAEKSKKMAENQTELATQKSIEAEENFKTALEVSKKLETEQEKLEKALDEAKLAKNSAEQKRIEAELAKNQAQQEKVKAQLEKAKAEKLAFALMPNEAKTDEFGYFWKNGKESLAKFNYPQAYTQLLMASNAKNLPPQKRDTVNFLYQKAEKLNKLYQEATDYFYKNNFALAQKKFMEIYNQNNADSLVWFYAKACGDVAAQDMVLIPEGEFFMGDSTGEDDEKPVHKVSLSAFYMSKYEVTHAQYARFLNQYKARYQTDKARLDSIENDFIYITGYFSPDFKQGIYKEGETYKVRLGYENRPLAWVSWYGAAAFCCFYGVKLPTEAQWEYAAGGSNAQYVETTHALSLHGTSVRTQYAGTNNENELVDFAWFYNNSGSKTHAVGTRKPNVLGLYDMSGNVLEWCSSWYVDYGEGYLENTKNSKKSSYRVLRGGSWRDYAYNCRVAFRNFDYPYDSYRGDWGFRFCRTK